MQGKLILLRHLKHSASPTLPSGGRSGGEKMLYVGGVVVHLPRILSAMAVEVRYPGMTADEDDAKESVRAVVAIREVVRVILGRS